MKVGLLALDVVMIRTFQAVREPETCLHSLMLLIGNIVFECWCGPVALVLAGAAEDVQPHLVIAN